jgi:HD superfamily phosphohydrolase
MLDALLAHHGLAINMDDLDAPLLQIGDGINANSFGIADETHKTFDVPSANVLTSRDMCFVKECIHAEPLHGNSAMIGRPTSKEFLYDIVSNRHSGLDVDKMDYYARDQKRTLGTGQVDFLLIEEAFVARGSCPKPKECFHCKKKKGGKPQLHYMLSWPEKLVVKAMEFFKTRFSMHSNVYTHKTVKAVEYMVCDALLKADPHLRVPDGKGGATRMSQAMADPGAYVHLKDSVLDMIESSDSRGHPDLQVSKKIISRIRKRDLYKCVLAIDAADLPLWDKSDVEIAAEICAVSEKIARQNINTDGEVAEGSEEYIRQVRSLMLRSDDLIVEKRRIHHGMHDKNPVDLMRFVGKQELHKLSLAAHDLPVAKKMEEWSYESHIPRKFMERKIRIYVRQHAKGNILLSAAKEVMYMSAKSRIKLDSPAQGDVESKRVSSTVCLSPAPQKQKRPKREEDTTNGNATSSSQPSQGSESGHGEADGGIMFSQDSNFGSDDEEEKGGRNNKREGETLSQGSKKRLAMSNNTNVF